MQEVCVLCLSKLREKVCILEESQLVFSFPLELQLEAGVYQDRRGSPLLSPLLLFTKPHINPP